ncbi:MAG TPA: TadE/TadG family type IV pilus assembly protein [Kiloniellaceae bacterium]
MFSSAAFDRVGCSCLTQAARLLRARLASARALLRTLGRPLLRDERGSALIEFALIAPPFFLLLIGTLEVSMMFFASAVLEGATKEAARQIRTGQVQESADPLAAFQAELCGSMVGIIDCSKVVFNVKTFSSFSAVSMPIEVDEEGEVVNTGFLPGGSGAVTVVRSMYRWKFSTPLMETVMPSGLAGRLLVSTVAFQNEPYNVDSFPPAPGG